MITYRHITQYVRYDSDEQETWETVLDETITEVEFDSIFDLVWGGWVNDYVDWSCSHPEENVNLAWLERTSEWNGRFTNIEASHARHSVHVTGCTPQQWAVLTEYMKGSIR